MPLRAAVGEVVNHSGGEVWKCGLMFGVTTRLGRVESVGEAGTTVVKQTTLRSVVANMLQFQ